MQQQQVHASGKLKLWLLQLQYNSYTITLHFTDDAKCSGSVTDDDMDHADLVLGDDLDAVLEEVEKELGECTT